MASGDTLTTSLADSIPTMIAAARIVREYEGVMPQLVDKETLAKGSGTVWNEVTMAQLTAQSVTESTTLDNPQQMSDTLFSITPTVVGIQTVITDRVGARIDSKAFAKIGSLAQNAIQRKKDEDGITVLDGATVSLCGDGNTLASGHISAAVSRIASDTDEPGHPPYRAVLHPLQLKDLEDELTTGVGATATTSSEITEGLTARVYREGYRGMISNAQLYEDGNIATITGDDAKGGVFAQEAIVLVQGFSPRTETKRMPELGGGATAAYIYDEYAYGERSSGNWLYEIYSDATVPTS
jgi:hypothetical protein